jgi:hypothetical protein
MFAGPIARRCALLGSALIAAALLSACDTTDNALGSGGAVTATDAARLTRSGFLTDYARLRPTPWGQGIECWRAPNLDAQQYGKVLISRI